MSGIKKKSDNFQKADLFGSSFGSSGNKLPNDPDEILRRLKMTFGVETDTDLAKALNLQQGSISKAKQKRAIPPSWVTTVALSEGVSADWLLTGEGEMKRGEAPAATQAAAERPAQQAQAASIYNDSGPKKSNISDLVAKTIEVLQSNTVFQFALESNIEAFHHAIVLERKIDQVEGRIMEKISGRLDALESDNQRLHAENTQLRHDLEHSRASDTLSDTG